MQRAGMVVAPLDIRIHQDMNILTPLGCLVCLSLLLWVPASRVVSTCTGFLTPSAYLGGGWSAQFTGCARVGNCRGILRSLLQVRRGGVLFMAPVCSSWVWLSRHLPGRSWWRPLGCESAWFVREGNIMAS
eukprot:3860870-Alexandrium_andersonii.AAC.1